jgi:hypothetical protein
MVIWLREQGAPDADVLEEARRLVRCTTTSGS